MLAVSLGSLTHWQEIEQVLNRTWGEDDYVQHYWCNWVEHPEEGLTAVALWEGLPVGTCHVAYHENHTAWFHAMRIDPGYQGRGIAGELARFCIEQVRQKGYKRCLAAIDMDNIASQKATLKIGFELCYTYEALRKTVTTEDASDKAAVIEPWQAVPLCRVDEYLALLKPYLSYPRDKVMIAWELVEPSVAAIKDAICWGEEGEDKRCFFFRWQDYAYAAIYDFDEAAVVMSPVCSDLNKWQYALGSLEAQFAAKGNQPFVIWLTADDPLYLPTIEAGYRVDDMYGYQVWQLILEG